MIVDLRIVSRLLGMLMLVLSGLILGVAAFSGLEHATGAFPADGEVAALMISAAAGLVLGLTMIKLGRSAGAHLGQREALLLVAMSWILGAAVAAAPYRIWSSLRTSATETVHSFDSSVNCYFETMSGLTTTGATILTEIESLPRGLLLWRSLTHWIGGLGIVVLFVAVLPMLGVGGRRMYRIEAPGPTADGVTPKIKDTARILWIIYCILTVAETIALKLAGMTWFEAVCHTMATLATGGFSTNNKSIEGYEQNAIHIVIIVFMVLAGVNFGLYHQVARGKWRGVLRDTELRVYMLAIGLGTCIVGLSLYIDPPGGATYGTVGKITRDSLFQVAAMQTTTGFCSADFDQWGFVAKATIVLLMFVGGCAGSTGGGIKVMRLIIAAKVILAELEHAYRQKVVRSIKVGRTTIDQDLRTGTLVYILVVVLLVLVGTLALKILEPVGAIDITSAATASIAMLNNIGPGLVKVGATQNYDWFTEPSKVVLTVMMLLGRLEFFTVLVLLSPRFWRSD